MAKDHHIALLKFGQPRWLNALLDGSLCLNTPEYYRLSNQPGVSDKNESCLLSYRWERDGESPYTIQINNHKIPRHDLRGYLVQRKPDRYLHCWYALRMPRDPEDKEALKADLRRMMAEFGSDYLAIPLAEPSKQFSRKLKLAFPGEVTGQLVHYTADANLWGVDCKSSAFAYQSEYRFLFGTCENNTVSPLIKNIGSIRNITSLNGEVIISYNDELLLKMNKGVVE